ncbi:molecular chaperone [Enterobacter sp. R1(2018)]|uniref:fimbrial biogenesis chaperone n=1 Tax=Enterobacter sp. R1(2018) TaxID=2447891 RepID=UPI000EAFCE4A|nr:fimbria/pilus periplasmic chaperone [Enterobacter sp. R1(2018)]RKQ38620.1 long polar fimbrial chaperone LpfB [Enterobacter sp. R1(2018)]
MKKITHLFFYLSLLSAVFHANAGVIIGGTRVLYEGTKKEASINLNNPDKIPYLVQSWVENEAGTREGIPFIATPPLFRLDAGQQNVLRIVNTGSLPDDKESLYWLNIKTIPSLQTQPGENTLQIAVKTRIKLIYRPSKLSGRMPESVANELKWAVSGNKVSVTNPTNFYMHFSSIKVAEKSVDNPTYVAPGATKTFEMISQADKNGTITWQLINDYGGVSKKFTSTY